MKSNTNNIIPRQLDLHLTQAIDTYVNPGTTVNTLAVKPEQRAEFFAQNPEVKTLLLREKENPLLEEGKITSATRDRAGEYYLTYEAITLLIEKKIRNPKKSINGLHYNSKRMFAIKNAAQRLQGILSNLDLMHGEDAKIIYITEIHSVPFYLRNEEGQIKCFIIDSEAEVYGKPDDIIDSVKTVFPGVRLFLSKTTLQKDFYSCSTFAVKAMMYFAKHGVEIFPWLEKNSIYKTNYYSLAADKLMPALLKMCQSKLLLSDDILDTIVCHKLKITLREYYARHAVSANGKAFNSSGLLTKYKYLFELNDYIINNQGDEKIAADTNIKMPRPLEGRHIIYARVPMPIFKPMKMNPVNVYLGIIAICDNLADAESDKNCFAVLAVINKRFPLFNSEYQRRFNDKKIDDELRTKKLFFIAACTKVETLIMLKSISSLLKNYLNYLQLIAM